MWDGPLGLEIKRRRKAFWMTALICLALSAPFMPLFWGKVRYYFQPEPIFAQQVDAITPMDDTQGWARFHGPGPARTLDVNRITALPIRGGGDPSIQDFPGARHYFSAEFGGRIVLIHSRFYHSDAYPGTSLMRGLPVPLPKELREIVEEIHRERGVKTPLAPWIFDEGHELPSLFNWDGMTDVGLTWTLSCTLLPIGLGALLWALWTRDPMRHPLMRRLISYGGDARSLVQDVDQDFGASAYQPDPGAKIGHRWALIRKEIFKLEDLMWFYREKTTTVNGVTTSKLVFHLRDGRVSNQVLPLDPALEVLHALNRRAPWAFSTMNDELSRRWKNNRREFIAEVDARRSNLNP
jgi:hypothetical protein